MTSFDDDYPPDFPIDAISRRALQEGQARRERRRARRSLAGAAMGALLLVAGVATTTSRGDGSQQVASGSGDGTATVPESTAATVTAQPGGSTAPATQPVRASNGRIFFVRTKGPGDTSPPRLYSMNADGSDQALVRELPTNVGTLEWSRDGSKLVFDAEGGDIFVLDLAGSQLTRVIGGGGGAGWPTWSPDGRRIAFRAFNAGDAMSITVANADGSDPSVLVTGSFVSHPAWSPDGRQVAYANLGDEGSGLWTVTVDTKEVRQVLAADIADAPAWSPDGGRLAFRGAGAILVVSADGSGLQRLVSPPPTALPTPPGGGDPAGPVWSPDGSRISYGLYASGEQCSIWTMGADGSGRAQLTDGSSCDRDPAWQPRPG